MEAFLPRQYVNNSIFPKEFMSYEIRALGYELRQQPRTSADLAIPGRPDYASEFLLWADEKRKILSIDWLVWPRILTILDDFTKDERWALGLFMPSDQLPSLEMAYGMAQSKNLDVSRSVGLFVSAVIPSHSNKVYDRLLETPLATENIVAPIFNTFETYGYDVADTGTISALTNCGYRSDSERQAVKDRFGKKLNQHGLFSNVEDALEFAECSNLRVLEHAPFFPYLIQIEKK